MVEIHIILYSIMSMMSMMSVMSVMFMMPMMSMVSMMPMMSMMFLIHLRYKDRYLLRDWNILNSGYNLRSCISNPWVLVRINWLLNGVLVRINWLLNELRVCIVSRLTIIWLLAIIIIRLLTTVRRISAHMFYFFVEFIYSFSL